MKISVCVPVHNALYEFKRMISSVMRNTKDFTLFICDDASNSNTNKFIKSLPAKRIIVHRTQQWFTRSSNDLLLMSYLNGSDYTFLVNSDIEVPKNWTNTLIGHFDKTTGLVGSDKSKNTSIVKPPAFVTGHCWCIKTSILETTGILDEKFPHIESDKEFCFRLNQYKLKTIVDGKINVKHVNGASWGHNLSRISYEKLSYLPKKRPIRCISDEKYLNYFRKKVNM